MGWNAELLAFVPPLLMCAYALIKHGKEMVWWEGLISLLLCTTLIFVGHYIVVAQMESDQQYGIEHIDRAVYKERYEYIVLVAHKIGKTTVMIPSQRVSEATWNVVGNLGTQRVILEGTYQQYKSEWGNSNKSGHYETTNWLGGDVPKRFLSTQSSYLNPLQLTRRAYAYPKVTEKEIADFALQQYPDPSAVLATPQILGARNSYVDAADLERAEEMLKNLNATAGQERKFQAWIILFPEQPPHAAELQEALWCNGNHNEFVVCIGTKGSRVSWMKAFSWTEQTALLEHFTSVQPEEDPSPAPLSLTETVSTLEQALVGSWAPHDLQKYRMLDVELPYWGIGLISVLACIVNGLFLFWAVENDFCDEVSLS